jgi:hypothetical protein
MTMNYGSSIPAHFNEAFERYVFNYRSKQRDSMLARNLSTMRDVGATVQTDTVTFYEKSGGNDKLDADITAKGAVPPQIGVKGQEKSHPMYQISVGFMINGRDLALDPGIQKRKVEVATADIKRREDYTWINGHTATGLTGLDYAAGVNPNGKIVATGASGADANNIGNWAGTDTNIDIHKDILNATTRIGDNFEPKYLVGRRADIAPLKDLDDMRNRYADKVLDLFGASKLTDFVRYSLYCPSGYVYVVAQDMEFMEFVVSEDLVVDTGFGKEAGNNYRVELREWVNPVEFHSNEGVTEISTL